GTGLTYQWFASGAAIAGATQSTFTIRNAQESDARVYSVQVTTGVGANAITVESATASLQLGADSPSEDKFKNAPGLGGSGVALASFTVDSELIRQGGSVARGYSGAQVFSTVGATKE